MVPAHVQHVQEEPIQHLLELAWIQLVQSVLQAQVRLLLEPSQILSAKNVQQDCMLKPDHQIVKNVE